MARDVHALARDERRDVPRIAVRAVCDDGLDLRRKSLFCTCHAHGGTAHGVPVQHDALRTRIDEPARPRAQVCRIEKPEPDEGTTACRMPA